MLQHWIQQSAEVRYNVLAKAPVPVRWGIKRAEEVEPAADRTWLIVHRGGYPYFDEDRLAGLTAAFARTLGHARGPDLPHDPRRDDPDLPISPARPGTSPRSSEGLAMRAHVEISEAPTAADCRAGRASGLALRGDPAPQRLRPGMGPDLSTRPSTPSRPGRCSWSGATGWSPDTWAFPAWDKPPLTHWAIAASMAAVPAPTPSSSSGSRRARDPRQRLADRDPGGPMAGRPGRPARRAGPAHDGLRADAVAAGRVGHACSCWASRCAMTCPGDRGGRPAARSRRASRWLPIAYFGVDGAGLPGQGAGGPALIGGGSLLFALLARRRPSGGSCSTRSAGPCLLTASGGRSGRRVDRRASSSARVRKQPRPLLKGRVSDLARQEPGRAVVDGAEDPFYYFYTIPFLFLPWTPWALSGLVEGCGSADIPRVSRLLASWFAVGLVFLSTRRSSTSTTRSRSCRRSRSWRRPRPGPPCLRAPARARGRRRSLAAWPSPRPGLSRPGPGARPRAPPSIWSRRSPCLVLIIGDGGLACHSGGWPARPGDGGPLRLDLVCVVITRSTVLPSFDLYGTRPRSPGGPTTGSRGPPRSTWSAPATSPDDLLSPAPAGPGRTTGAISPGWSRGSARATDPRTRSRPRNS